MEGTCLGRIAGKVCDLDRVGVDGHHLILAEFQGVTGVFDEGGDVGGEEVLSLPQPDDER